MIIELWPLASTTTSARTVRSPRLVLHAHADRPAALEQHFQHARALVDVDAVLGRVVEQHLVELAADHLPGLRRLVRLVVDEIERLATACRAG